MDKIEERPKLKLTLGNSAAVKNLLEEKLKTVVTIEKTANPKTVEAKQKEVTTAEPKQEKPSKPNPTATSINKVSAKEVVGQKISEEQAAIVAARKKRKIEEFNTVFPIVHARYPDIFTRPPSVPLAIGIGKELMDAMEKEVSRLKIRRFLQHYCGDFKYKRLLKEGATRIKLDGSEGSKVTKEEAPPPIKKKIKRFKPKNKNDSKPAESKKDQVQQAVADPTPAKKEI